MMNKSLTAILFFVATSVFFVLPLHAAERTEAMKMVNTKRVEKKLSSLERDEDLCKLAQLYADDSELAYPQKIITSNPRYTTYLKNYPHYVSQSATPLDMLVDFNKKAGIQITYDDKQIVRLLSDKDSYLDDPEITHGCIASSGGKVGYKPFIYFVGGVRREKNMVIRFIDNILQFIGVKK